jgi:hypothetical protein
MAGAGHEPDVERNSLAGGGLDDPLDPWLRLIGHVSKLLSLGP